MSALRHGRVPSPAGSRVASSDTSGDSKRVTIPPSQPCHLIVAITSPTRPSGNRIGLARGYLHEHRTGSGQRFDDLAHQLGGVAGCLADRDAGRLQGVLLGFGGTGGARDNGASMTHGLTFRGGEAGDVTDYRFGDVGPDVVGGALFSVPADLTDHHHGRSVGVVFKGLQGVDMSRADNRITTYADTGGETDIAQLEHHLVGEGAGF